MTRSLLISTFISLVFLITSCTGKRSGPQRGETGEIGMPADTLADNQARTLYSFLRQMQGRGTMIGHEDALAYGMGWKGDAFRTDIHDVCGDFPAVFGWDLGHIGDSANIDGVPFDRMPELYRSVDVAVVPSLWPEPHGPIPTGCSTPRP